MMPCLLGLALVASNITCGYAQGTTSAAAQHQHQQQVVQRRPNITRHGTWDLGMVETTPINVKGQLWLFVDSAEQPCGPQGCFPPCSAGIEPCVPGQPVTKPCCSPGGKNLRFIDVLSGDTVGEPFGTGRTGGPGGGEGLGCALYV